MAQATTEKAIQSGKHIGNVLRDEGVEYHFGLHGGHIMALLTGIGMAGLKMIHTTHEQGGPYAADGYIKASRKPAISFSIGGPGLGNAVSAIMQCYSSSTPLVHLAGQASFREDGKKPNHESQATQLLGSITKYTQRVVDPASVSYWTKKALKDAWMYPQGPVCLEIPTNILAVRTTTAQQVGYVPHSIPEPLPYPANPAAVEKAMKLLLSAERPVVAGGQDIWYDHAEDELREFIELTNIPVITRRLGRGTVPEDHPLAFKSSARSRILRMSDVAMTVGLALDDGLEGNGAWAIGRKLIQVCQSMALVSPTPPTEQIVLGHPKMVLKQMIDWVKQNYKNGVPKKDAWIKTMQDMRAADDKELIAEAEEGRNMKPLHPAWIAQESIAVLQKNSVLILDGRSASTYLTTRYVAKQGATLLEGGRFAGFGQGICMGIGAQIARPNDQVLVGMGDAGMGVGGMDFETAVRVQAPVVYQVHNNFGYHPRSGPVHMGSMKPVGEQPPYGNPVFRHASNYAQFAEAFGGIGMRLEDPADVRKVHEKAFNVAHQQKKPVIVDCVTSPYIGPRGEMKQDFVAQRKTGYSYIDPEDLDEGMKKLMFPELFEKK